MSFYNYNLIQQLILPNTSNTINQLINFQLIVNSYQLTPSKTANSQLINYQLAIQLLAPNRLIETTIIVLIHPTYVIMHKSVAKQSVSHQYGQWPYHLLSKVQLIFLFRLVTFVIWTFSHFLPTNFFFFLDKPFKSSKTQVRETSFYKFI